MSGSDSTRDEKNADEASDVKKDPPGPADHGRDGGMATRELAPELTDPSEE